MDPKFHSKVSQNYNVQNALLSTATSTLNVSWVKTTARYNAGELKQTFNLTKLNLVHSYRRSEQSIQVSSCSSLLKIQFFKRQSSKKLIFYENFFIWLFCYIFNHKRKFFTCFWQHQESYQLPLSKVQKLPRKSGQSIF